MTTNQTLYKRTSTGKIEQWHVWTEGSVVYTEHGYIGGKLTQDKGTIAKAKNVGRANETTPDEQAVLEATSKWNKKIDGGYKTSKESAENDVVILPMLALNYEKRSHNIKWPAAGQPKFDGVRCQAMLDGDNVKLITRKGKAFPHLEHIREELKHVLAPGTVLDGELYSDELPFERITGAVRRQTLTSGSRKDMEKIEYHVYDAFFLDHLDLGFKLRFEAVKKTIGTNTLNSVKFVKTVILEDDADVHKWHKIFTGEGYEGIIVRNNNGPYGLNKRSKDLQKFKHFLDGEYKIIGFEQGKGNETGCVVWVCETQSGARFNVRPKGSREERRQWFSDGSAVIGKLLTVKYQELSQDGIPRFPVGVAIRDYE